MKINARDWRQPLSRPLANAHWSLPILIVATWLFVVFGTSCEKPSTDVLRTLLASTILIASWASHLRAQALRGWRKLGAILGGAAYDLFLLAVATLLCTIPLVLVTGAQDCMTPRTKVGLLLLSASSARVQIEAHALANHDLHGSGSGVSVDTAAANVAATVTADGIIIIAGDDPPAVAVLQPKLASDHVTWDCKGFPTRLMPSPCR